MNTLEEFLNNKAGELLQNDDLIVLAGGKNEEEEKDINALADCKKVENTVAGCGGTVINNNVAGCGAK